MTESQNPYRSPQAPSTPSAATPSNTARILAVLFITLSGICIGSYVSAELLYLHYPEEIRTPSRVMRNTAEAVIMSPLAMTFGVIPTLGFYGTHGFLVVPGVLLAVSGSVVYFRYPNLIFLAIALIGFALWSHNNFLSFNALMSV